MKKLLLAIIVLAIAVTFASYLFIPSKDTVVKTTRIAANSNAIFRALTEPATLKRLIRNDKASFTTGSAVFDYNNVTIKLQERMNDIVEVSIDQNGMQSKGLLKVIPLGIDSSLVEWRMPLSFTYNPFERIKQFIYANSIKAKMMSFLNELKVFASNNDNIYGVDIKRTRLTDSLLITTKTILFTNPTPDAYYSLIKQLQAYADDQNAMVTNYPMLNITVLDGNRFETQVALPINKSIPTNGAFVFKRMVPKNILIADIKGGQAEINRALEEINNYMTDNDLVAPAIPFQSLVTDRLANKDSSLWMTRLYFPIF
jgi:hypothetical protein